MNFLLWCHPSSIGLSTAALAWVTSDLSRAIFHLNFVLSNELRRRSVVCGLRTNHFLTSRFNNKEFFFSSCFCFNARASGEDLRCIMGENYVFDSGNSAWNPFYGYRQIGEVVFGLNIVFCHWLSGIRAGYPEPVVKIYIFENNTHSHTHVWTHTRTNVQLQHFTVIVTHP